MSRQAVTSQPSFRDSPWRCHDILFVVTRNDPICLCLRAPLNLLAQAYIQFIVLLHSCLAFHESKGTLAALSSLRAVATFVISEGMRNCVMRVTSLVALTEWQCSRW